MSNFIPLAKGTILVPSGRDKHLHIICNDPTAYPKYANAETVLLVNITTLNRELPFDDSCILNVGDHPFIRHESYVYYSKADIFASTSLVSGIQSGELAVHQACPAPTFSRILSGFDVSKRVSGKIKNYYKKYIAY